jgi:hypothetical protein
LAPLTSELIAMTMPHVPRQPTIDHGSGYSLVDDKAWQHLGITGQEFRRLWYAGAYVDDDRPEVHALDRLMRTGLWQIEEL